MAKRATAVALQREPLSKERVLRTAMRIADSEGIDALSMRGLASELGVEAMSLYYYVKNKDEMLAGIAELALSEIEPPVPGRNPMAAIRAAAVSYHDALRRHPWAHGIITGAIKGLSSNADRLTPAQTRYMEAELRCLRLAGFSPRMTHHAYHLLDSHVVGSTLWEAGVAAAIPKGALPDLAKSVMERLPPDRFPYTHEHIQQHIGKLAKGDKTPFEFGLDLILDGLERLRDEPASARREVRRRRGPTATPDGGEVGESSSPSRTIDGSASKKPLRRK